MLKRNIGRMGPEVRYLSTGGWEEVSIIYMPAEGKSLLGTGKQYCPFYALFNKK